MHHSISKANAALAAGMDLPTFAEGTQIIRDDGWYQIINPSLPEASANEVMRSLLKPSEVDQRIQSTFALYEKYKLPFKWCVGPMSSPAVLDQRLAALASASWEFRGMAIDSSNSFSISEDVNTEIVNAKNFSEFLAVNLEGWDLTKIAEQTKNKLWKMVQHPQCRCFLVRKGDQQIGSAGTIIKNGYGYLVGAVILEKFRGCGAYKALTSARLTNLATLGIPFAVTQARESTSAPILERLGFETIYRAKIHRFDV